MRRALTLRRAERRARADALPPPVGDAGLLEAAGCGCCAPRRAWSAAGGGCCAA
jgi:hypothetical protein